MNPSSKLLEINKTKKKVLRNHKSTKEQSRTNQYNHAIYKKITFINVYYKFFFLFDKKKNTK